MEYDTSIANNIRDLIEQQTHAHKYGVASNFCYTIATEGFSVPLSANVRSDWYSILTSASIIDDLLDNENDPNTRLQIIYNITRNISQPGQEEPAVMGEYLSPALNQISHNNVQILDYGFNTIKKRLVIEPTIKNDLMHIFMVGESLRQATDIKQIIQLREQEGISTFNVMAKSIDRSSFTTEDNSNFIRYVNFMNNVCAWANVADTYVDLEEDLEHFFQNTELQISSTDRLLLVSHLTKTGIPLITGTNWINIAKRFHMRKHDYINEQNHQAVIH